MTFAFIERSAAEPFCLGAFSPAALANSITIPGFVRKEFATFATVSMPIENERG